MAQNQLRILDETTGRILADRVAECRSPWSQWKGLMFRPAPRPGEGVMIERCGAVHTLGVRFAIDAVFYDKEGRVTRVARNLRPWLGLAFGGRRAHGVIELPAGEAKALEPGNRLRFEGVA